MTPCFVRGNFLVEVGGPIHFGTLLAAILRQKRPKYQNQQISTIAWNSYNQSIDNNLLRSHKNFSPIGPKMAELCPNMGITTPNLFDNVHTFFDHNLDIFGPIGSNVLWELRRLLYIQWSLEIQAITLLFWFWFFGLFGERMDVTAKGFCASKPDQKVGLLVRDSVQHLDNVFLKLPGLNPHLENSLEALPGSIKNDLESN